jgi:hypothetical protein
MRNAQIIVIAFLAGAAAPALALTDGDFRQLMGAAVTVATQPSQVQPQTKRICIEQELTPPLEAVERSNQLFNYSGVPPWTGDPVADRALSVAVSSNAAASHQTRMPPLPPKYIVGHFPPPPPACLVEHVPRPPGWPKADDSAVVLSFSRPALANGYAFIEEYEDCPGLCGTTFLRVFRKEHGTWVQVAQRVLSVS